MCYQVGFAESGELSCWTAQLDVGIPCGYPRMRVAVQMMVNLRNVYGTLVRKLPIANMSVITLKAKNLSVIIVRENDLTLKKDWAKIADLNND